MDSPIVSLFGLKIAVVAPDGREYRLTIDLDDRDDTPTDLPVEVETFEGDDLVPLGTVSPDDPDPDRAALHAIARRAWAGAVQTATG